MIGIIMQTKQQLIDSIIKSSKGFHKSSIDEMVTFINSMLSDYSAWLGISESELLERMEKIRDITAPNFYQRSKFPQLKEVTLFDTTDDLRKAIGDRGFRCPKCGQESKDYQACDSILLDDEGNNCNWKAYGLFGTMGKGLTVAVKEQFLKLPQVWDIFMPINMEKPN